MIIIDIQRGGPSTGLPTKTEASDLNLAIYGRHGEAPAGGRCESPADCFDAAIEAARIALKYRTPVILCQTDTSLMALSRGNFPTFRPTRRLRFRSRLKPTAPTPKPRRLPSVPA